MSDTPSPPRSPAFAAAVILLMFGLAFFFLPSLVLSVAEVSPFLGAAAGAACVLAFFAVFWLRARYQRRRGS
ncbi:hypothetical protein [Ensifer soli]|uniref:hypothetical protein n=1 Tax=Ciceribacter sp. sgz301302 TaxID=3342379 RepID=UPI0035B8910A